MAAIGDDAITAAAKGSPLQATYGETKDRESAYEKIEAEKAKAPADQPAARRSKNAPAPTKKESWIREYLRSREGRSLINKLFNLAVQLFTKSRR
jgi:hypothetical protein